MSIQYSGEELDYKQQQKLTLAYVRSEIPDVENYKKDFMTYIGGKKNIYCVKHKSPLIASTLREETCVQCKTKKEYFCCCQFNCNVCLCKNCADTFDPSTINFVPTEQHDHPTDDNDIDNGIDEVDGINDGYGCDNYQSNEENDTDNDIDESLLIEPYHLSDGDSRGSLDGFCSDDSQDTNPVEETDSFDDDFEDFLLAAGNVDNECGDDNDDIIQNVIPATNAGETALHITDNPNQKQINRVSGHVILNQCGSLLSQRSHTINGSSKHKFFLQKIHSTTKGESVPLLYPEGMLFPSIFPFPDPDGISSVGCIPAPLLSTLLQQSGFESIPQHIQTRLTAPFCEYQICFFIFLYS